jgi:hypothetical protein
MRQHRMIDHPPVDPVRMVVLILAVAFALFALWVMTRPAEESSGESAIRGAVRILGIPALRSRFAVTNRTLREHGEALRGDRLIRRAAPELGQPVECAE